jgi:predicted nucleotidyltransferase component of viral defense system
VITKQDVLDRAASWKLRPDVVELLAGLASVATMRATWILKGGTCIKKCYVETYRFSEDLDFSLLPDAPYTADALRAAITAMTSAAADLSGVRFPTDAITVRERRDKLDRPTFEGRVGYIGPLAIPTVPRVLLDITRHEPVLDPPAEQTPFHPYPDAAHDDLSVLTYSPDELLAEKVRALYERTRPRDLYDVVYLLENLPQTFDLSRAHALLKQKCDAKNLTRPDLSLLLRTVQDAQELRTEWGNMLAHQLPELPDLDVFLPRLSGLLRWVDQPFVTAPDTALPAAPIRAGAFAMPSPSIEYWGENVPLEAIRFAGLGGHLKSGHRSTAQNRP